MFHKYAGEICAGAQLHVVDRDRFLPYRTGVEIIMHTRERYDANFQWKPPPYEYEYDRMPIESLHWRSSEHSISLMRSETPFPAASDRRSGSGTWNAHPALTRWISGVSILALSVGLGLAEPEFATDKMSDAELREFRNLMRSELQRLLGTAPREETPEGAAYRVFYCTIYYTPRESGFTAERGFDERVSRLPD